MKRFLIYTAAFILVFLAGFVPQYWKLHKLQVASTGTIQEKDTRIADLETELRVAQLQGVLGMMVIDVHQGNFGKARDRSTPFFDGIRDVAAKTTNERMRKQLDAILNRRDEVVSGLTAVSTGVSGTLESMYTALQEASAGQ